MVVQHVYLRPMLDQKLQMSVVTLLSGDMDSCVTLIVLEIEIIL